MKRQIVTISILVVVFFSSIIGSTFAATDDLSANKQLVLDFVADVFNKGNVQNASTYASAEYIQHSSVPSGIEVLQGTIAALHTAFPDIRYSVYQIGAQDDLVAARLFITGTQKADFMNIPASGKPVAFSSFNFWRVKDGKLVEHWEVMDSLSMLQQLGVIPVQGEVMIPEVKDTPITIVTSKSDSSDTTLKTNRALVNQLFDTVLNVHDLKAADAIVAGDYVWHNLFVGPGLDGFKGFYMGIFEAFPDVKRTADLTVADGDLVFVLNSITGTHKGGEKLYGIKPSGNPIQYSSADIFRVAKGQLVEQWDVADYVTLFGQIGLIPKQS